MKRFITILFVMLAVLYSCSEYLEEELVTESTYSVYETEEGCEALINSCYQTLRYVTGNEWSIGLFEYGTDEFMKGEQWTEDYPWDEFNDYTSELDGHTKDKETDVHDVWNLAYNAIDRCNVAVNKIPQVDDGENMLKDDEGKNQRLAEVRFIRAFNYFLLVQHFGAVPVTLDPTSTIEYEWPRQDASDVYDIILDDLEWAYDNIPEEQDDFGRITKDAVRHYWAKVLLTRNSCTYDATLEARNFDLKGDHDVDLAKAAALIEEIEAGGRHSLVSDYATLWEEGQEINDEVILSSQFNDVDGLNGTIRSYYLNKMHLFYGLQYDVNEPGMNRTVGYGIPFRRVYLTDYAIDIHDRLNDSRLRKSLDQAYLATLTNANDATIPKWTKEELAFAFGLDGDMAADSSWAIRYGDTVKVGERKFEGAPSDGELGDTALLFLVTDENTTLTDRQIVAMGYKVYARYYWATDELGNKTELIYNDSDDPSTNYTDVERYAVNSSSIVTYTWSRNKAASLVKFRDGNRVDKASYIGTRDFYLARLAESYLIAAEAYGRIGNYAKATEFINKVRKRAAYHEGETKPDLWYKFDGGSTANLTTSTEDNMLIENGDWNIDANETAWYPEDVDTEEERFIAFILNERCREFLGELKRWEDIKRTGTLVQRAYEYNVDVTSSYSGNSALRSYHMVRPIPSAHLDNIKQDDQYLSSSQKIAYQNDGYY